MVKRINLALQPYPDLCRDGEIHWNISGLQPFFPTLETVFKGAKLGSGIRLKSSISAITAPNMIRTTNSETVKVHRKTTMLLSPYKWMKGEYGTNIGMPTTAEHSANIVRKIQNPNNYGYVGALLASILSESDSPLFPRVHGVFTGIAKEYVVDISDDYAELIHEPWFVQNVGKLFDIRMKEPSTAQIQGFSHTRADRNNLILGEETTLDGISILDAPAIGFAGGASGGDAGIQQIYVGESGSESECDSDDSTEEDVFDIQSCDCSDADTADADVAGEDDEDGEPFAWAVFKNVPVITTVMEECVGTFYELFKGDEDITHRVAWMIQVIAALAHAQQLMEFVHNDLHSNNIMYVSTELPHITYQDRKIPTYGKLIKIIDFERGTAKVKIGGMKDKKTIASDHFSIDEEACGQYNYSVFKVNNVPEIKPNMSFDLTRLATSMFWDLFPNGPAFAGYADNVIYQMFMRWLTLSDGNSVMFGKKVPRHDRYHGFELYKAIARFSTSAVPETELQRTILG
jgi:hypothetical protein